jgi:glycosyltransferase involved in cell wall biosynthesis
MASGTAVIASANGQLIDVIQDGFNGCLVPPGDVTAMTVALKRLIEDEDLRIRLGKQARQDAVKNHSWNQYINRLEQLFATVIQR